MASATKLESGKWQIHYSFRGENGIKYRQRAIEADNEEEAMEFAVEVEEAARTAAKINAKHLTRDFWQDIVDDVMVCRGLEPLYSSAKTLGEISETWLESRDPDTNETLGKYKRHVNFLRSCKHWKRAAIEITGADVDSILADYGKDKAVNTTSFFRTSLYSIFALAERADIVKKNPVRGAKQAGVKRTFTHSHFTFEDLQKLRLFLSDYENAKTVHMSVEEFHDWRGMMELALCGAVRIGDSSRLTSESLEKYKDVWLMSYKQTKTGGIAWLPCSPQLMELIEGNEGDLFPTLRRKPTAGKSGLSARWIRIQKAAGVDPERQESPAGRSLPLKSFHSFRSTAASYMLEAGVPERVIMKVTGHKDRSIFEKHYVKQMLEKETLATEAAKVSEFYRANGV